MQSCSQWRRSGALNTFEHDKQRAHSANYNSSCRFQMPLNRHLLECGSSIGSLPGFPALRASLPEREVLARRLNGRGFLHLLVTRSAGLVHLLKADCAAQALPTSLGRVLQIAHSARQRRARTAQTSVIPEVTASIQRNLQFQLSVASELQHDSDGRFARDSFFFRQNTILFAP